MITEQDIREAVWTLMKTKWPEGKGSYRYYMREIREAYIMPCFFIYVDLDEETPGGVAVVNKKYTVRIQYYEKTHSEKNTVEIIDGLRELFRENGKTRRFLMLNVQDRYLYVKDLAYGYLGSEAMIPEISFRLDFFDSYADEKEDAEIMKEIKVTEKITL